MAKPNLLERRGPRDKRAHATKFMFNHDRAEFFPCVYFRLIGKKLHVEIDVFSMRDGWTSADDDEQWEDEKIHLWAKATRAGFRDAYRCVRSLLNGRSVTFAEQSLLSLDRLHPNLANLNRRPS